MTYYTSPSIEPRSYPHTHPRPPLPHLQLPHIAQEGTWDCGVACVQMALTYAYGLLPPEVSSIYARRAQVPSMDPLRPSLIQTRTNNAMLR